MPYKEREIKKKYYSIGEVSSQLNLNSSLKDFIILISLVIRVLGIKWEKLVTKIFSGAFLTSQGLLTTNVLLEIFSKICVTVM